MTRLQKTNAAMKAAGFALEHTGGDRLVWIRRAPDHAVTICTEQTSQPPRTMRERCVLHTFTLEPDGSWGHDEPTSTVRGTAEQLLLSVKLADWHAANVARSE